MVSRHHEGFEFYNNKRGPWRESSPCFWGTVFCSNVVYYHKLYYVLSAIANLAAFAMLNAMTLPHQALRRYVETSNLELQSYSYTDRLLDLLRRYPMEPACCVVSVWDIHSVAVCQGNFCRVQRAVPSPQRSCLIFA